jgi:hypothetical protein
MESSVLGGLPTVTLVIEGQRESKVIVTDNARDRKTPSGKNDPPLAILK